MILLLEFPHNDQKSKYSQLKNLKIVNLAMKLINVYIADDFYFNQEDSLCYNNKDYG
jgi:hypothetical protein